jgi:hypothetical protein
MTSALEGREGSASPPGRTLPPGKTRYPLYRRLGEPQGRSGNFLILQVLNQVQGFNLRELGGCPGFQVEGVAQPNFVFLAIFFMFLLLFKWAKYSTVYVFCQLYRHLCHPRSWLDILWTLVITCWAAWSLCLVFHCAWNCENMPFKYYHHILDCMPANTIMDSDLWEAFSCFMC